MTIQEGKSEKAAGAMVCIVDQKISRKRPRGSGGGGQEFSPSVIIPTEDENLAHTLVMLSHGGAGGGGDILSSTANDDVSDENTKSFKCDVCGKDFPSYQALGGHKASHRPKPIQLVSANHAKNPSTAADYTLIEPAANAMSDKKAHVCPKCGKSFTKGQSLGGHMRLHYDGTKTCKTGTGGVGITKQRSSDGGGGGRDSNCSILSSSVITPSVSQESGCGGGDGVRDSNLRWNYIGTSKNEVDGQGQEIGLDLELRLGRDIQVDEQKPKKKPRLSLTLALDL